MTKTTKKLAAKIDEIDEAVDGRISAMEWQISEARKLAESAHNHIREHRKITEDVAREASKTRKHAQTNQETLVQHATELGRLRAADHDAVVLIRDERARITALEKHFGKAAADSNHDRQRLEQLEQFVSELHNRICDLEPKDVDPRQDPRQCPEEQSFYEPEPRKAPPEVMRQMGEAAATFGPCNTVQPEEQWVRTADLERLHKRAEAAEMARDQALEWQQRTQAAKQQARDEVDAAMAECRELRAQRDDWKDRAEAADETVERLEHALMDRTRQNQQLEKTIRDHQTSIERLHGYVDQKEREAARDSEHGTAGDIERLKADVEHRDCQIAELQLRLQQQLSDEMLRPKWLYNEVDQLRAQLREANERGDRHIEWLNGTIQMQARMMAALGNQMGVTTIGLSRPAETFVPSEEAQRKAREAFDKHTETEETSDDDRPDGHDRDSGEAADCNGGTAAQREVDLGEVAGDADSQP